MAYTTYLHGVNYFNLKALMLKLVTNDVWMVGWMSHFLPLLPRTFCIRQSKGVPNFIYKKKKRIAGFYANLNIFIRIHGLHPSKTSLWYMFAIKLNLRTATFHHYLVDRDANVADIINV